MIDMGFRIKISPENKARLDAGFALARETKPAFRAEIDKLTVPQLKAMVRKVRSTHGMTVRQHYVDALLSWHTGECLKAAGYVQER